MQGIFLRYLGMSHFNDATLAFLTIFYEFFTIIENKEGGDILLPELDGKKITYKVIGPLNNEMASGEACRQRCCSLATCNCWTWSTLAANEGCWLKHYDPRNASDSSPASG